ncbi:MAG TPA: TetR family transcriptional regulator [Actinomycetes bacterium]|jgi:AcrR family transcriptional regulator|nr:TetR family transcriptional regulator [Actinomycetes bacterium]
MAAARTSGRTGRRPGSSGTRDAILEAARREFAQHGYDRATIRNMARGAGVDPALVHYFFGTKTELFTAAMQLPINPAELAQALLAGEPGLIGQRLIGTFLAVWDHDLNRSAFIGLLRSAVTDEHAATLLREFAVRELFGQVAAALGTPDAELRASLVFSQIFGLAVARYILRIEPLASTPAQVVAAAVGPTIQRYITGDLGRDDPPT